MKLNIKLHTMSVFRFIFTNIPNIFLFLVVTTVFVILFLKWTIISPNFWNINIADLSTLLVSSCLILYLGIYINKKQGYESKQKDIKLELLISLQDKVCSFYQKGLNYMNIPDNNKENHILGLIKSISLYIKLLENQISSKQYKLLEDSFFEAKKNITSYESFRSRDRMPYPTKNISSFQNSCESFIVKIIDTKLQLYC